MPGESAYVDTSILGAYYCPEPLSAAAEARLRSVAVPLISTLTDVEFSSLIARKRRLRELDARQATNILRLFASHVADGSYRTVPLGTEHFLRARDLIASMTSSLGTLDALHLAAAIGESVPILTADRELARAAKRHRVQAVLVT